MRKILTVSLICLLVLFAGLAAVLGIYRASHPLALKARTLTLQLNEPFDPLDNIRYVFLGSSEDVRVEGYEDLDVNQTGQYSLSYIYDGTEYPFVIEVKDTLAPQLEVMDYTTDMVEEIDGSEFVSYVFDDSPFTISIESPSGLDTAGQQKVTVTATDTQGNTTRKSVTLTRIEDQEAPSLAGFEDSVQIRLGHSLDLENVTISDNLDTSPVLSIDDSALDPSTPGDYQVVYTVSDRSGNSREYVQNVNVKDEKIVYLTFDDGPSQNTKEILDILDQYGVKATFFVTAQNPEYFDYMKEAAQKGHTIAIHTLTHNFADLYSSPEAYFQDLDAMKQIIYDYTGQEADCIRFPGGSSNTISADYTPGIMSYLVEAVHEAGYEYFDWNVDSQDASGNGVPAETIIASATASIGEPNAVILFHDTDAKDTTVQALPAIIEAYLAAGYEFEGVSKDSYPAHHGVNN